MVKTLVQRAALLLGLGLTASSFAATPLSGMWSFEGELTGKPGRGFQIDTQGSAMLVMSYFGYRTDGSALFLQASGPRDDNGNFSADLVEYRGGTVLGGAHQDGEQAEVVGVVQAIFDTPTTGTIQLPGEHPRRVQRFQYSDLTARFNDVLLRGNKYGGGPGGLESKSTGLRVSVREGVFKMTENETTSLSDGATSTRTCVYEGTYVPAGSGLRSTGIVKCDDQPETTYRAEDMQMSGAGYYTAMFYIGSNQSPVMHSGTCSWPFVLLIPMRCGFGPLFAPVPPAN